MHMADALLSPQVGAAMWAATAATTVYCAKSVTAEDDPAKVPLMGVTGAFVFAAQMLNFTIPGTGSSGHLGGGLILALMLGPEAAFLTMASVLAVQALFFADGGLLALGSNVFNLGFFPAFVAYPLVYKRIVGTRPTRTRVAVGAVLAAVVGLQLGAFGVVLQTTLSGVSELPFGAFVALVQPIHLAIGVVEGVVTAAVALFVMRAQPELLEGATARRRLSRRNLGPILATFALVAVVIAGSASWIASTDADGLEWSIQKLTGSTRLATEGPLYEFLAGLQRKTAVYPGYQARSGTEKPVRPPSVTAADAVPAAVGSAVVLALIAGVGAGLRRRAARHGSRST